jgi:large subunit ribosomal protein L25
MMEVATITIAAEKREQKTKGALKALRRQGKIPAVLYGQGLDAEPLQLDMKEVRKLEGYTGLVELKVDGTTHRAMVRQLQKDPVSGSLLHLDLYKIRMDQPVDAEVPLVLTGEAPGVKVGGVLQQTVRTVELRALPDRIPEEVELDVSGLEFGESITLESLVLPEGVQLLSDPSTVAVSVVAPETEATEEEEEPAAEGEEA